MKECSSHGLPNFTCDAVFAHCVRELIIPHLVQNAKHLLQEVSNYMTIAVGVLTAESTREYPLLATEFETASTKVRGNQRFLKGFGGVV